MNFGKKKFFALTIAVVMMFGVLCTVPGLQSEAQAATVVEQKLQEYISANPAGGAAYNCMTFAKQVFKYVFGYDATGIDYHGNYESDCSMTVTERIGNTGCGQVSGNTSGNVSVENLKMLFSDAKPGDIIQAMTGSHGKHTMVFVAADDSGVTVYHGNWNGKIAYTTFSYEKFAGKWSHTVTVYHANNYDYVNNPLNAAPITANLALEGESVYPKVYEIDGVSYYSLRDIAYILADTPFEFSVSVDNSLNITVGEDLLTDGTEMTETDGSKKTASLMNSDITVNGKETNVDYYEIEGKAYFPIRQLGNLIGFDVEWNSEKQSVNIAFVDSLMDDVLGVDGDVLGMHTSLVSKTPTNILEV
ncbi:MAG: hypothetical protein ACOX7J_07755 [Bacillota bacterium]|jgi:hypothetical protein